MKRWIKRGTWVGVILLLLFSLIGNPLIQEKVSTLQTGLARDILTVGLSNVAYAATPDYPVSGDANDEVQAALTALPATGGKIIIFGGNYTFTATVFRTINNVTFEGSGKSTYLAYNTSTPLISAGSQTGWMFKDIRTDAGWFTLASDTIVVNCWDNETLVNNTNTGRTATYVVAASDALAHVKAQADYVCDGTADNEEIQAAIDAITVGEVVLQAGTYNTTATINFNKTYCNLRFLPGAQILYTGGGEP